METSDHQLATPLEDGVLLSSDDKQRGMLAHIGTFLGAIVPFGNIIVPLILMSTYKGKSAFVVEHSKESLNFQISLLIYYTIAAVSLFVLIGFLLLPLIFILSVVYTIIAGVAANEGKDYKYPLTIRFVK